MDSLEKRTLPDRLRFEILEELWDKFSVGVRKRRTGGRMCVYVPTQTPPGREEDYRTGGMWFVDDSYRPIVEYVQRRMADDGRYLLVFSDYLHRVTDPNDFLATSGYGYVQDSAGFVYLYVRAQRSSYARILKLINDASGWPRIGFLTTGAINVEDGGTISDGAIDVLAERATDAFIGMYDEETLGIWTF